MEIKKVGKFCTFPDEKAEDIIIVSLPVYVESSVRYFLRIES